MKKKVRKIAMLSAKLLLAGGLLAWVLSGVHWNDYVAATDAAGKTATYAISRIQEHPALTIAHGESQSHGSLVVTEGRLWWASQKIVRIAELDFTDTVKKNALSEARARGDESVSPPSLLEDVRRRGVRSALGQMNILLLVLACLGFLGSILVIAVRWWFLLRIQDITIRLWEAVRLTFLGQFFNYVIPGSVGGDLVKAYYVSKHTPRKAAVLVSVFVDRVLGLTELVVLGGVMLIVIVWAGMKSFDDTLRLAAYVLGAVSVLVMGAFVFLLSPRFRKALRLEKLYQRLPIAHHIAAAGEAATLYRKRLPALGKAILFTLGAHVLVIGAIALVGLSLNMDAPWYTYFVYVPVIFIIAAVPITPGAVGVTELLYQTAFASSSPSTVIVLALLARLIPMFWGLPGAIVAVTGTKLPKAKEMEAELNA
ncbi:MAG: flippase-like domain-containing protein [Phycisphaerae bacterium]|nr:flippase-like domain-containing protein [Phycisphaerae bacterium]